MPTATTAGTYAAVAVPPITASASGSYDATGAPPVTATASGSYVATGAPPITASATGSYAAVGATPVAAAGNDFTVDPNLGGTFALSGGGSPPAGRTITGYAWADVTNPGTPVALGTAATLAAVPVVIDRDGTTCSYQLTVTDSAGQSGTDTVVVTFLPHNRWMKTAGGLIPVRRAL